MRNLPHSNFGRNLNYLRLRHGLTQEVLAGDLGMTRARVSAYEESRNEPNHAVSCLIARYFKVSLDKMITTNLRRKRQLK